MAITEYYVYKCMSVGVLRFVSVCNVVILLNNNPLQLLTKLRNLPVSPVRRRNTRFSKDTRILALNKLFRLSDRSSAIRQWHTVRGWVRLEILRKTTKKY